MGKWIALTAGRGGSGTTTTLRLLGEAFANEGRRTLLVEQEPGYRCLDVLLHLDRVVYDLGDLLAERCTPRDAFCHAEAKNLWVIAAPSAVSDAPYPPKTADLFRRLAQAFDVVLTDTPRDPRALDIAAQADQCVVLAVPDAIGIRAAGHTAERLIRKDRPLPKLCINRIPAGGWKRREMPIPDLDQVIDAVGAQLAAAIPESSTIALAGQTGGSRPAWNSVEGKIFTAFAKRLEGEQVPLIIR